MAQLDDFAFSDRHLVSIEALNRPSADSLLQMARHDARNGALDGCLAGRVVTTLFAETSTRTHMSFEIAAKRLGAHVINFAIQGSSMSKGESLRDTARTLDSMSPDIVVVRHRSVGAAAFLAGELRAHVVNAGDGPHQHPTQALLDAATLLDRLGTLEGVKIAICGDLRHSRVARSSAQLFHLLGAQVRLIGPPTLIPHDARAWGASLVTSDMDEGIAGCDVVMALRIQHERMGAGAYLSDRAEYRRFYGLDHARLNAAKPTALAMHPGPMNRGVEISAALADDPERCLVEAQVAMGVPVRMAVLAAVSGVRGSA